MDGGAAESWADIERLRALLKISMNPEAALGEIQTLEKKVISLSLAVNNLQRELAKTKAVGAGAT